MRLVRVRFVPLAEDGRYLRTAQNWMSTQPLTPTTPGLSDAGFRVSSRQPSGYC